MWGGSGRGRCVQFNWGGSGANVDWVECGLGRCAIVGRIPYWGCKSNLCGGGSGRGRCVQFNWGGSGANVDWGGPSCFPARYRKKKKNCIMFFAETKLSRPTHSIYSNNPEHLSTYGHIYASTVECQSIFF